MKLDAAGATASLVLASGSAVMAAAVGTEPSVYEGVYFNVPTLALVGTIAGALVTALIFIHKLLMAAKDQQIAQVKDQATTTLTASKESAAAALLAKDELITVITTANNHLRQRSDVLTDLLSKKETYALELLTNTIKSSEETTNNMIQALNVHTDRSERAYDHVRRENADTHVSLQALTSITTELVGLVRGETVAATT